jgi:hypothetical protein
MLILLCLSQQTCPTAIGQKKAYYLSLTITRDTRKKDREKSSGRPSCSIIGITEAMDGTTGQAKGQAELIVKCFFENSISGQ